ncbi:MAG: aminoglycoside phosphotransferase family protein [Burkholderiales bacterium]|nr:aminoglycoside phosphotransferase family protein [Nitrosomonas sp.]MCP5274537.1 aminoglycoside phosphotransferase family protein [Burkholderiales bacterium]
MSHEHNQNCNDSTDLVYQDSYLPHMSALLDTATMTSVLTGQLASWQSDSWTVFNCRQVRVKYKPRKNCLAVYEIALKNQQTNREMQLNITCRTYEHRGSERRYRKAQKEIRGDSPACPAVFHVPELEMVVWIFPCERKLLSLPLMSNNHYLKHVIMPELVTQTWGKNWRIQAISSEIVHYVPEQTCTTRVHMALIEKQMQLFMKKTLYGKCYYNHDGARTFRVMDKLHDASRRGATPLNFPKPLSYDAENKLLWQEGLSGQTLRDAGISDQHAEQLLPLAAKAIALFHRISIDMPLPVTGVADIIAMLHHRMEVLSHVSLIDQLTLKRTVRLLEDTASTLNHCPLAVLHGDVHSQNLFLQGESIALIDLDNVTKGPPLLDLASWAGGMIYWAAMQNTPVEQLLPKLKILVTHYNQYAVNPVNGADLNWYLASILINERVFRCVTRLKSGRLRIVNKLLNFAEEFALHQHRILP